MWFGRFHGKITLQIKMSIDSFSFFCSQIDKLFQLLLLNITIHVGFNLLMYKVLNC